MTPPAVSAAERSWLARGAMILLGRGGDALLRFAVFLATARLLAPPEFSLYALLTAALATSSVVFGFGAPRTAMFFAARSARRPLLTWLLLLAVLGALFVVGGLAALPALRQVLFPEVSAALVLLGLAPMPFVLLCDSLSGALLGDKREGLYSIFLWGRTIGSALVLGLCLLSAGDRLVFLLCGRFVVSVAASAGLLLAQRMPPGWTGLSEVAPKALRYGAPIALAGAVAALHRRAGVLLLSAFGRTSEIGAYAVAYAMAEAFWVLTDSLEAALFADLTRRDGATASAEATHALRLYRLGALAAFALGLAAGEAATLLVFRNRYPEAAVLFPPALAAAVIWGSSRPCTSYLYSQERGRLVLATHVYGLAVSVSLCSVLIPYFGARGAVGAALASYAAEVIVLTRFFRRSSRTASSLPAETAS